MTLQGPEGCKGLSKSTRAWLITIGLSTDGYQLLVQGNTRLIQHPRKHHTRVGMWGIRPPTQQGRENGSREDSDQESRQFWKGLSNDTVMMQEGLNCALHRSADLLEALSRRMLAKGGEVDA